MVSPNFLIKVRRFTMNAEIVAVGTELLMGQIANTNAQYISQKLAEAGINVYYHSVVGDNNERLTKTMKLALERSDLIIVTGGLGPTQDDMTKQTIADIFNISLVMHQESRSKMESAFKNNCMPMTANNMKQVLIPDGSLVIPNDNGIAPGCVINSNGKTIVLFPGPPKEMKPMFNWFLINLLKQIDRVIASKYIRIFGIGESTVENEIIDLVGAQTSPTIATYIEDGTVIIRVTASAADKVKAEELLSPIVIELEKRFGSNIFSQNGESMEETVVNSLKSNNLTVSFAESCTGGMISARILNVSGSSQVFDRGVVTYSNESKVELLGVNSETIKQYGAVSHETAKEMAEGIRKNAKTDIGVSVTGIAGPNGGTAEKPVGLVYIGVAGEKGVESFEYRFNGNRDRVRTMSTMSALDLLRRNIELKITN
jgi:nicotinamide-nucleotide amidase